MELLPKAEISPDLLMHIKTMVGEEMFDSFRLYYGDDPERYNLSFEAIFATYCNKMEWVTFLGTTLALAAHTIRFDDLNRMTTGKMLFYIQVPRVATGTGVAASRQTTIMVTKYSEKHPITIPFELSAACLTHLAETFDNTLLDKLLNVDAINTVLRVVQNTADAVERGLVHNFLLTLLRKAPPYFVVRTLLENANINRQTINRVQRANILQSFKAKMSGTVFMLNRTRDRDVVYKFLSQMIEAVTESILDNPDIYVTPSGTKIAGVVVSTTSVIQAIRSLFEKDIVHESVRAPSSYGAFVMSKENAVTAIAHHSIMADFGQQADRMASGGGQQDNLNSTEFFDGSTKYTSLAMDLIRFGEKIVAIEQLRRVYKNTDTSDPLERTLELTFFFPVGLFLPSDQGYATVDLRVRLTETMQNILPLSVFFYNKDRIMQRLDYSDALLTLCHPIINDAEASFRAFEAKGPPKDELLQARLCRCRFDGGRLGGIVRRFVHFYERQHEAQRTVNEIKQDFPYLEFYKPSNPTVYTELHPMFDFTHHELNREIVAMVAPRIMIGNLPLALAPPEFQELRAQQVLEHVKIKPGNDVDGVLRVIHAALNDSQYPELFHLITVMVHGNETAFNTARALIVRVITVSYQQRGILPFVHSLDMIILIVNNLGGGVLLPGIYSIYRNILSLVRFLYRVSCLSTLNTRLADEPMISYVQALHDRRLFPPFLDRFPREDEPRYQVILDTEPIADADIAQRSHGTSDAQRMAAMDDDRRLFVEGEHISDEDFVLHKIYYYCVIPAMCNNRACGLAIRLRSLLLEMFYRPPFLVNAEAEYGADAHELSAVAVELFNAAGIDRAHHDVARELFALVAFVGEHAKIIGIRTDLDPAQRQGVPGYEPLQIVMYNGCCTTTAPRILARFAQSVPFHRFYSDPNICAMDNEHIRRYLEVFPNYNRNDGGFPLTPELAREYLSWHRSPFSRYTGSCQNTLLSIVTVLTMHHKFSAVSTALHSRLRLHPGFALTAVRTDVFETDSLLYSSKSSTAVILNTPTVTKEERDINTTFHVTQNICSVDMGMGYSSATCTALLRRVRTDMGAKVQDLFQVFPMHVFRNKDVDNWIREHTGAERQSLLTADAISILTFGGMTEKPGSALMHGQRAVCELILTPVTADINYFKTTNNPRGRSSCMLGVDPYDDEAARRMLYNHHEPDAQTFLTTNNPWASQAGSIGDILYNPENRDRLGYNSMFYSPCRQFFDVNTIITANKTLFKTIDEYIARARDCIRGDTDTQYVCVEGTDELVQKPCKLLQEAYPLQVSTTQALLENHFKGIPPDGNETLFGNYIIGEVIPLQDSILFNSL